MLPAQPPYERVVAFQHGLVRQHWGKIGAGAHVTGRVLVLP
jgi:hypothetical protein